MCYDNTVKVCVPGKRYIVRRVDLPSTATSVDPLGSLTGVAVTLSLAFTTATTTTIATADTTHILTQETQRINKWFQNTSITIISSEVCRNTV